jgi:hypothetical protein
MTDAPYVAGSPFEKIAIVGNIRVLKKNAVGVRS